jgi:pyruvate formate lyase activating enzyme
MQHGLVFNIQRYSLHDGPGIRTTVFLKGCPLCCEWCHNPEGMSPRKELLVVESRCIVCGECRRACPFSQSRAGAGVLPTRNEDCTYCGECVEACPTGARQMVGTEMTVAEVMEEILKDRIFYEDSAGGATFSGGEPLMQPAFLRELLEECCARGIHTAVDTCGFGCTDHLLAVARLADLVLYDVKLMDDARHRQHTGVSNKPILENLKVLDQIHQNIWLRVPVIPGVNDDAENLQAIARFASGIHGVRQVTLLPYHQTGVQKYRRLGGGYVLDGVQPPSAEAMGQAADAFRSCGLATRVGA